MSNFKPFLQNIEPFLEKYDLVLRISKADNGSLRLVVSPIGKNAADPVHTPVAYRGSLDEVAGQLEDPTKGLEEIGQQAHNISITWQKEADDADTKKGKSPARKTTTKKAASTTTTVKPEPPKEEPKQTSLLDQVEEAEAKGKEPAQAAPAAPSFTKDTVTEEPTKEEVDPILEKYAALHASVTREIRSMSADWGVVDREWKELFALYKNDLKPEQREAKKAEVNDLRNEMISKWEAHQEELKALQS